MTIAASPTQSVPVARINAAATGILALALVAAACLLHIAWMLQNHDADWMLVASRRMLAGGHYLTDFNEVSPPMILVVIAPAAGLAALLGLTAYPVFVVYVGVLIALSTLLIRPALRWCLAGNPLGYHLALIGYATILAFEPGYEFGQREHIFLILFFPGLLWYAAREAGAPARLSAGDWTAIVLAAAGLLIKPLYLLIPGVLLIIRAARMRQWRALTDTPILVFAAAVLLFGALLLLVFPNYLAEARLQRPIYFGWNRWWGTMLDSGRDCVAAMTLATALACLLPGSPRHRHVPRLLCVTSFCCLLVVFIQRKGWPYHYLPALEIAAFVLVFAASVLLPRLRVALSRPLAATLIAVIAVQGAFLALRPLQEAIGFTQRRFAAQPLIRTLHDRAAGQSVMLLTSGMSFGFPSLAGVEVGARHPGQVMLAGVVQLEAGDAGARASAVPLRQVGIDMATEDLNHYKPDWVGVDLRASKQGLPDNFDVLAYYLSDPGFRAAWAGYELNTRIAGWDLYTRKPAK
jgi:hypothetical protein